MSTDYADGAVPSPNPASRKQPPVVRTQSIPEQARLLWQALRNYAQRDSQIAEGGYYWTGSVKEVAATIFVGVYWSHEKHASNFLRPILGYLSTSGNAKIIRTANPSKRNTNFEYQMWIRSDWSLKRGVVTADRGRGLARATESVISEYECSPCDRMFLTAQALSQHRNNCSKWAEAEIERMAAEAALASERIGEVEPFEAIEGVEGLSRGEYEKAMGVKTRDRQQQVLDRYESVLRGLKRDWNLRTPDSLQRIYQTLDDLPL